MAYLTKDDLVIIPAGDGGNIPESRVVDVRFRRYRKKVRDRKTGKEKMVTKSMPYAVCSVFLGGELLPVGTEFLIPGYQLRNETKAEKAPGAERRLLCQVRWAVGPEDSSREQRKARGV